MNFTEREVDEREFLKWIEMLGRDDAVRLATIKDLLKHANGDEMSADDYRLCIRALEIVVRRLIRIGSVEHEEVDLLSMYGERTTRWRCLRKGKLGGSYRRVNQ